MTSEDLIAAQRLVRRLPVGESVVEAILQLVRSARPGPEAGDIGKLISWGPGPRASQALMLAVRARALLDGRFAPSVDDVIELAEPVLKHRMALTFAARAEGENHPQRHRAAEGAHRITGWPSQGSATSRRAQSGRRPAAAARSPTPCRASSSRRAASPRPSSTACTAAAAPVRARISGSTAASCPASLRSNVDWRRSARDDFLYVREREWEASHTVWIWPDRSPSMAFASALTTDSKLERGLVVAFALAEVLVQGGERIGLPGLMRPTASRNVIEKMAQAILHDPAERTSLPPSFAPSPLAEIVVLSDLWSPVAEVLATIGQLSASGAHGHVVQIVDPAEESFPYSGRIEFIEPEGGGASPPAAPKPGATTIEPAGAPPRANPRRDRPAGLDLRHPPHRPSGERIAAGAAFAHGRQSRN